MPLMVRQVCAPSAVEASFMPCGTRRSMSSVVRTMTGIEMIASATAPAMRREMPHAHHEHLVDEQADDDRWRAQQHVVDEADHDTDARRAPVLGQVGAGQDADRRADGDADAPS